MNEISRTARGFAGALVASGTWGPPQWRGGHPRHL